MAWMLEVIIVGSFTDVTHDNELKHKLKPMAQNYIRRVNTVQGPRDMPGLPSFQGKISRTLFSSEQHP